MPDRLSVSQYVANPNLSTEVPGAGYAIASGGATVANITAYGIPYRLHTFTSSANLTVDRAGYIDILLVGAGGKGGGDAVSQGGGGGGGDLNFIYRQFVPAGTYSIVIGAGNTSLGLQGGRTRFTSSDSVTLSFIAHGGGTGSYLGGQSPYGGSGGGGGVYGGVQPGGSVQWANYGNNGATAVGANGGGGGGAGAAASGVNGGNGLDISLWLGQAANTTIRCGGGAGNTGTAGTGNGAANTGGGGVGSTGNTAGFSGIAYVRSAPQ